MKHVQSKQFILFLLTGGIAATVNFCSRIIFNLWISFSMAVILAYITGMVTAFILAKFLVFKESNQSLHQSIIFFILVNIIAILQTWIISMLLAYYLLPAINIKNFVREISHAVGIVVPVFSSYIGHKHWSFR